MTINKRSFFMKDADQTNLSPNEDRKVPTDSKNKPKPLHKQVEADKLESNLDILPADKNEGQGQPQKID